MEGLRSSRPKSCGQRLSSGLQFFLVALSWLAYHLTGSAVLLGAIAGIMVVDYFIIRRQKLDLAGLYQDGVYPAWHWNGFIALSAALFWLASIALN